MVFNRQCIDQTKQAVPVLGDVSYEETVNMKDVTRLLEVNFDDTKDMSVSQLQKLSPIKAKSVNFLDTFANPIYIGADSGWEVRDCLPETGYLRGTRNRNCVN